MKEGNIKFQFPLRKGMEHFPRKRIRPPYESFMRALMDLESNMTTLRSYALCLARGVKQ